MLALASDIIPNLSGTCEPIVVRGTAALTTLAVNGADPDSLAEMIDVSGASPGAKLYDTAIAYQLAFRRTEGLGLQDDALAASQLYRVQRNDVGGDAVRLLALMAPGDLMVNTPLDFITNHLNVKLDLLFLLPGRELPAVIPDHDVMFMAASEADPAVRARMTHLFKAWPRPVLNDPSFLPMLARDTLSEILAGVPGLLNPLAVEVSLTRLKRLSYGDESVSDFLPGCTYPVLIRPAGSHAGIGLKKIDSPAGLASYLLFSFAKSYFLTAFVDYRSPDGLYRKYRIAFIDRQPHLCHMAASQDWMVHYLNAGMTKCASKRADEAHAMVEFHTAFAARHRHAFDALHSWLPFDYYSIDCSELSDGRLLVFEADTAAIIHAMDPVDVFSYKRPHMQGVFEAFGDMLHRCRGRCFNKYDSVVVPLSLDVS